MLKRTLISCLATLLVAAAASPQRVNASGGELLPEQAVFDVQHYDLTLSVDPARRAIRGRLGMRARMSSRADRVALHLDDRLTVERVEAMGAPAEFDHADGVIWIPLQRAVEEGATLEVAVWYGGEPRVAPRPPWEGGFSWERSEGGHPWIATSCQGEGADLWWPCKDHPSDKAETMDLRITVPRELICAANGTLQSDEDNGDGTRTFHWRVANPINNYCVALNIARYSVIEASYESVTGEQVPVFFFVLPESRERGEKVLPEFLEHLRFFEDVCGPYPFRNEKYGIAETPHLGMEHQTIIAYGNKFRRAAFDYDWLHHHELAHEWWANLVTCRDWKDMWLHEGFGTYMQALYIERQHGAAAYRVHMRGTRRGLNNRRAVAPREVHDSKQIYFLESGEHDNDIYQKGSWVLHTLRWLVGDEAFFAMLRRMAYPDPETERVTDGSQVRFVDTEDFRAIAEAVTGEDLAWFFDVYLRQPALPKLSVARSGDQLQLRWAAPDDLPFPMPVEVEVAGARRRVDMSGGEAVVEVPSGTSIKVDPDAWLLMEGSWR